MQRKRLVKSALMLAAFSGLVLTQGCDEEDSPISAWMPVRGIFVSSGNANAPANTGGSTGNNSSPSLNGLARTGISGNQVSAGGVP